MIKMTNRKSRKEALKKDMKYVFEELQGAKEEYTFCKIFMLEYLKAKEKKEYPAML